MNNETRIENIKRIIGIIFYIAIIILVVGGLIYSIVSDKKIDKEYGTPRYEFVVVDLYEDLGSTWHLIGGRATEQKYHVIYKYRITNRPDRDDNMIWCNNETTISGSRYRRLHVGQTLYNTSPFFPSH